MPFTLSWPAPQIAMRTFRDHLSDEDFVKSFTAVMSDIRFDDLRFSVVDLTALASEDVEADSLELLAASAFGAAMSNPRIEVLVITPETVGQRLVERFSAVRVAPYPVHVLQCYEAANSWFRSRGVRVGFDSHGRLLARS